MPMVLPEMATEKAKALRSNRDQMMEEVEKFFKCPSCLEKISMLLDVSVDGMQNYVEDCEVCCHPIQVQYNAENGRITFFEYTKAYE